MRIVGSRYCDSYFVYYVAPHLRSKNQPGQNPNMKAIRVIKIEISSMTRAASAPTLRPHLMYLGGNHQFGTRLGTDAVKGISLAITC